MLKLPQTVLVKWSSNNKKYFISKGYIFTKIGDEFFADVRDLTKGSKSRVDAICEYCQREYNVRYADYYKSKFKGLINKYCCTDRKCTEQKRKESTLLKFGVESTNQLEEVKERQKQSCLNKYGKEYYMQTEEGKERRNTTIKEVYGVENISQSVIVKEKVAATFFKNGTKTASRQQIYLHKLFGGILNYPFKFCSLDIAYDLNNQIYIEYDGGGHNLNVKLGKITQEEFIKKEQKREFFLKSNGWKQIRIVSSDDFLPSDEVLLSLIRAANEYILKGHTYFEINIDESKVRCSEYERFFNFGKLRQIYQSDLNKEVYNLG